MEDLLKRSELAHEAVNLINEIINEVRFLGEDLIQKIKQSENGCDIIIKGEYGIIEYSLSEVSYIFIDSSSKLWRNGENFYEVLKNSQRNKSSDYKKVTKDEFIDKYGKIEYLKIKSKEIINRLKDIEQEV